jgi:single-stranded-DNA-specific exonuclease
MPQITTRPYSPEVLSNLNTAGFSPLLARIYAARGVTSKSQLDTALTGLHPFKQLRNNELMASLLADTIAANKQILIVADYDADGATACAVGVRGLRLFGAKVDFIVPNRFDYGYGLTPEIVRLAAAHAMGKPDILLTVDNGIASVEGVAEANRLGIEVLVTDHHLPGDQLPEARCIVNPNQVGCDFPSKNLAGVGVMFYVLLALRAELRQRGAFATQPEPNLGSLLDLVALGTVADVVKLDDNNRILVQQGLQRIRAGRACAGINALLQATRRAANKAAAYDLGFVVGPRLNAAGRLDDMSLGIRCLLTDDSAEANQLAAQLDGLNHERRAIEADMQQEALAALVDINPADSYSLVLFDDQWHQGVIGILASRLKDKFHRPTLIFAPAKDGDIKGSGRSIAGLHLRDALDLVAKRQPHLLQKFGGHAMAAGLTLRAEHFDEFKLAFEAVAQSLLRPSDLVKEIETDGNLLASDFSLDTAQILAQQVWGQGFPEPLFVGEFKVQQQRIIGEKHLKLKLLTDAGSLDAIQFFSTDTLPETIRAVYSLSVNEYNGSVSLQLLLRHWQTPVSIDAN